MYHCISGKKTKLC